MSKGTERTTFPTGRQEGTDDSWPMWRGEVRSEVSKVAVGAFVLAMLETIINGRQFRRSRFQKLPCQNSEFLYKRPKSQILKSKSFVVLAN